MCAKICKTKRFRAMQIVCVWSMDIGYTLIYKEIPRKIARVLLYLIFTSMHEFLLYVSIEYINGWIDRSRE